MFGKKKKSSPTEIPASPVRHPESGAEETVIQPSTLIPAPDSPRDEK